MDPHGTIHETLNVNAVELTSERVVLDMPIGPRVHQPHGLLHGGASAVLAESAASIGAFLNCDPEREYAVGIELNISHLRTRREGRLRATAVPVRKGRSLHVWSIDLEDGDGERIAVARCTLAIRKIRKENSDV
jgi:1,4-dihydroxy-2-naphthoyl-CoA hydrolase